MRRGLETLWRWPFWALALATGAKSFADNRILGSRRLNRHGLHVARLRLAHRMAWARRKRLASAVPAEWRQQFDRDGFAVVPEFLPPEEFARLRDDLLSREFETRQQQQGDTLTRRVPIGPEQLRASSALCRMLEATRLKSLLSYVGATRSEPIFYIQTIVTGVAEGPPDPQLELHSDTFHPSLKAWLFLTDVESDRAPLIYVPGSHRLTLGRVAWERAKSTNIADADRLSQRGSFRISSEELPSLCLPEPRRFSVPANTLVAIDTSGFHARGTSDAPTVRVEIWAYCRRNPFLPWTGFDLLSWRPLAIRRGVWLTLVLDWLDRLGIKKQHWRPAGRLRPIDRSDSRSGAEKSPHLADEDGPRRLVA